MIQYSLIDCLDNWKGKKGGWGGGGGGGGGGIRIPWTRNNPGQVERKAKNRKNISFIVNWPFLITLFKFFFKLLLLLLLFSTFESYRLWSVTTAGKNTLKSVTLPSFKVIIANEAIAPLAKSQNFTQSHICIVAGKNVFPTTEKLVWTNSQNL